MTDPEQLQRLAGILGPLGFFLTVAVIVIGVLYFRSQKDKMWNETARLAIEKGQPVPHQPSNKFVLTTDNEAVYLRTQVRRDVKIGLISLAVGIAIIVHLSLNQGWEIGSAGAIPGLIGVAFLLNAWITNRSLAKIPDSSTPPPRQ